MNKWLFDLETGLFTGRSMDAPSDILEANLPEGFSWLGEVIDWQSQRVDLDALKQLQSLLALPANEQAEMDGLIASLKDHLLLDYQPTPPSDDHEWIPERKRYRLKPDVARAQAKRADAQAQIDALELSSLRALRELRVAEVDGKPRPDDAAAKLKQIEADIEALRPDLTAEKRQ